MRLHTVDINLKVYLVHKAGMTLKVTRLTANTHHETCHSLIELVYIGLMNIVG